MDNPDVFTMITAHAGAENTRPNTLDSLRFLIDLPVDAIECDVRERDGEIYLTHNEFIPGERYDTLREAFAIIAPRKGLMVNIDLKTTGLVPAVSRIARECAMDGRFLFTGSVGDSDAKYIREHGLECWYNEEQLDEQERRDSLHAISRKGFNVLNTYFGVVGESRLQSSDPQRFSVWTVNEEESLKSFLRAKVKNITTRTPLLALRLRAQIQGQTSDLPV